MQNVTLVSQQQGWRSLLDDGDTAEPRCECRRCGATGAQPSCLPHTGARDGAQVWRHGASKVSNWYRAGVGGLHFELQLTQCRVVLPPDSTSYLHERDLLPSMGLVTLMRSAVSCPRAREAVAAAQQGDRMHVVSVVQKVRRATAAA